MGMGPSGMAGQGYYNSGMGGFQGGFNMGPTSPPSPFAFSMYGSYPQGYGYPVQGNGQPGNGPWAAEPGYPTKENSTTEEQPAGQPISSPAATFLPTSTCLAPQRTTWLLPGSTGLFLPAPYDASISSTNRAVDAT